jgi:hypothetical protein
VAPCRSKQKLANIHCATGDIASDEVGVHGFEICRGEHAAGQDALAESGSEALDLTL